MRTTLQLFFCFLFMFANASDRPEIKRRRLGHWDPPEEEDVDSNELNPVPGGDPVVTLSPPPTGKPTSSPTRMPTSPPPTRDNAQGAEEPEAVERGQLSSTDDGLSVGAAVGIGLGGAAVLLSVGYASIRR